MGDSCHANPPCTNPKTHKPLWHRKETDCPRHPDYAKSHPAAASPIQSAPAADSPTGQPPTAQAPVPARKKGIGSLGWTGKSTDTEDAGESKALAAAEPKPRLDWLVDGPHTIELFKLIFGGIGRVSYLAADYLEVKEPPAELFVFPKPFAEAEIHADPKNYYAKAATWICQNLFRSKTQEDAHRTISTIGFGAGMLGMFAGIGHWYYTAFKTSPKLKRNREKAKELRERQRLAKLAQQESTNAQPAQQEAVPS